MRIFMSFALVVLALGAFAPIDVFAQYYAPSVYARSYYYDAYPITFSGGMVERAPQCCVVSHANIYTPSVSYVSSYASAWMPTAYSYAGHYPSSYTYGSFWYPYTYSGWNYPYAGYSYMSW